MPRQEVKQSKLGEHMHLYRLIPGQRRHLSLKLLSANGAMSHNQLYCNTVPSCVNAGRTRSIGTYNDTVLNALVRAKLIKLEHKYRGKQPPVHSLDMSQEDWTKWHNARFRKVSSYTITSMGELTLIGLNLDKLIKFDHEGDIMAVSNPGEY